MAIKIPKIIHFTWAGGNRTLPANNLNNIVAWHLANPGFKIYIWIDPKTFRAGNLEEHYRQRLTTLKQQQIAEGVPYSRRIKRKNFQFKDISELPDDRSYKLVRYEIDRLRPNYGSSSDLLRLVILLIHGGMAIDSDIKPGRVSLKLSRLFRKYSEHCLLYIDEVSQLDSTASETRSFIEFNQESASRPLDSLTTKEKSNLGIYIGNDLLIATPNNPVVAAILDSTIKACCESKPFTIVLPGTDRKKTILYSDTDYPALRAYYYDRSKYINSKTPLQTGPARVKDVTQYLLRREVPEAIVRAIDPQIRIPDRNLGRLWQNRPLYTAATDTPEQVISKVINSIKVEIDFGILRLEDHILNLMNVVPSVTRETAVNSLLEQLNQKQLNYTNITAVQNTGIFPELNEFFNQKNINADLFHTRLASQFHSRSIDVFYGSLGEATMLSDARKQDVLDARKYHLLIKRDSSSAHFTVPPSYTLGFLKHGEYCTMELSGEQRGITEYLNSQGVFLAVISDNERTRNIFSHIEGIVIGREGVIVRSKPDLRNTSAALSAIFDITEVPTHACRTQMTVMMLSKLMLLYQQCIINLLVTIQNTIYDHLSYFQNEGNSYLQNYLDLLSSNMNRYRQHIQTILSENSLPDENEQTQQESKFAEAFFLHKRPLIGSIQSNERLLEEDRLDENNPQIIEIKNFIQGIESLEVEVINMRNVAALDVGVQYHVV